MGKTIKDAKMMKGGGGGSGDRLSTFSPTSSSGSCVGGGGGGWVNYCKNGSAPCEDKQTISSWASCCSRQTGEK